jgi:hypothetical protein
VQELRLTEFWKERYGSRSFEAQNGLFRRRWGICGIFFSDWKALARMNRGSYEVWGFFGDFVVFF